MSSHEPGTTNRPRRTRGSAACIPCRQRKSRCAIEPPATVCLMCRAHKTGCVFSSAKELASPRRRRRESYQSRSVASTPGSVVPDEFATLGAPLSLTTPVTHGSVASTVSVPVDSGGAIVSAVAAGAFSGDGHSQASSQHPTPLDEAGDDNPHIVGPAVADDSHVLEHYLSSIDVTPGSRSTRLVLPISNKGPVIFSKVRKRPVGSFTGSSYASSKVQTAETVLEPWLWRLIDLYFNKVNKCFPIIDEASFRHQYSAARHRISPALRACLYANALVHWQSDPQLAAERRPNIRFIWNLALDALYSELHLYPGISTIAAIVLDIGGRPATTMVGNGVLLGAAISLAHSLGLNRDPSSWDIPKSEKTLRVNMWWSLIVHDSWTSFAHGTPPLIRSSHHDVPAPQQSLAIAQSSVEHPSGMFVALATLSEVLSTCLEHIYQVRPISGDEPSSSRLGLALDAWIDSSSSEVRKVALRGTELGHAGAANLRLAYLATRFLIYKIELTSHTPANTFAANSDECYFKARRSAEDIVFFAQELDEAQLNDFWLPIAAYVFSSTTAFLIRSAVERDIPTIGPKTSIPLALAKDLLDCLRRHKGSHDWDIGDHCITQYDEVVERLLSLSTSEDPETLTGLIAPVLFNTASLDAVGSNLWDQFMVQADAQDWNGFQLAAIG